jgi:hypothetical protein
MATAGVKGTEGSVRRPLKPDSSCGNGGCSKSVPKVYLIEQMGFYFERKQIP